MMPMMIDLSFLSRSGFGRRGLPALLAAVLLAAGCSSTPERGQRGKRVDPAARDGAASQEEQMLAAELGRAFEQAVGARRIRRADATLDEQRLPPAAGVGREARRAARRQSVVEPDHRPD